MITPFQRYILSALSRAKYDFDEDSKIYVASIPQLPGVVAQAKTIEAARAELAEVVEDWVLIALQFGDAIPMIGGVKIHQIDSRKRNRTLTHA
ncbi:type II toxin-antitoxin system HicB family antitoxin [Patescibacteria group bacterium]|nr:type II toxin-antitoxin system HicB family antitoxin [Patescibacteria group bacterium]